MRLGGFDGESAALKSESPESRPVKKPWSAIVLAGTRAERDRLSEHFGTPMKALVPVGGEPMVARVVRTLLDTPEVGTILILGQQPELLLGELPWLQGERRVRVAASAGGIAESLVRMAGSASAPWPVLVTTADHPLLTREMIEHFLGKAGGTDFSVAVVERAVLTRRYPESRRTWIRFKGGAYTGANLFAVTSPRGAEVLEIFAAAEAYRKQQLKLLWHFGPLLALAAAAGLVSMHKAIAIGARRLGVSANAVELPFAEAGVDIDRLEDHRLVHSILCERGAAAPGPPPLPVSVFDLDRTVTRRGTYTAFLLYAAGRHAPWRLLLMPAALMQFGLHGCGLLSRKRLKERLQSLFLGPRIGRDLVNRLAEDFAARLRKGGFHAAAVRQLDRERREGRRLVLATAANGFYAEAIARELDVDEVVCTQSVWAGDQLIARIAGENCHGDEKLHRLAGHFSGLGLTRPELHVRFFSDHSSDAAVFRWSDEAYVVNPKRRFRAYAARAGWLVLHWV
jgi:phosphoserine phosphatase/GTP:adenosylcobinamide-phosphate guanylyltransferase